MKKINILIIAYDWPPRNSIACHRPYAWAKYWSASGAKVRVLTAKKCSFDEPLGLNLPILPNVDVEEVLYWPVTSINTNRLKLTDSSDFNKIKHKAINFLKKIKNPISKYLGINYDIRDRWAIKADLIAAEIVKKENINILVSTFGPRSCHAIAHELKKTFPKLIWIADYRDLWSKNHLSGLSPYQKNKEEKLERTYVSMADLITTVSPPLADSLQELLTKPVEVIYNGFDISIEEVEENFKKIRLPLKDRPLRIIYTGMIYPGRRDPSPLFEAINSLLENGKVSQNQIEIHFYGNKNFNLQEIVKTHNATSYVHLHGHVSREEALDAQKEADILLLLESGEPDAIGMLTGKIFEYISSGTPVLSLGSSADSMIARVINQCGVGVACGTDMKSIQVMLECTLFSTNNELYKPNFHEIKKFSRKLQAANFLARIKLLV